MEPIKKKTKPYAVKPSLYAACVESTGGSLSAGGLLCQIAIRSDGNTLKDEYGVEGWLVATMLQWQCVTGFTRHQYNDALSRLKDMGLIQFRRRKLRYVDPAAITWLRLTDSAKAEIAEIMARPAISAFPEITPQPISGNTENIALPTSDKAEPLTEMNITEKEDTTENVIIGETTTLDSPSNKEVSKKKEKKSKPVKNKSGSNKEWFNTAIQEIYKGSNFSPEPYKESAATILRDAKEYLEGNPGGYLSFCPAGKQSYMYALAQVITKWDDFSWFAQEGFGGFNLPQTPQLWSLKHQLKVVPDFIKYTKYAQGLLDKFTAEGIHSNTCGHHIRNFERFGNYLETPEGEREQFLTKIMLNSSEYSYHQKWGKQFCTQVQLSGATTGGHHE